MTQKRLPLGGIEDAPLEELLDRLQVQSMTIHRLPGAEVAITAVTKGMPFGKWSSIMGTGATVGAALRQLSEKLQ